MSAVTGRYARAFVDVVIDLRLNAGDVASELHAIADIAQGSRDLSRVWESPAIPAAEKRSLLDAIVARQKISRPVRNFIAVLIDHRRTGFLGQVVKDFDRELNRRLGFAEAEITAARELTAAEKRDLEGQVERIVGKKVRASYVQDESILGGAMVRVGSTIYDGSVKGQLERIREQLSS
ncbi:MAG TPA: ATP synthase F1 subunit delta [Terriglobales bacterium]|jgi:F-type H+-transporting ATPase subunit delta